MGTVSVNAESVPIILMGDWCSKAVTVHLKTSGVAKSGDRFLWSEERLFLRHGSLRALDMVAFNG
jgi:hypothetical protein